MRKIEQAMLNAIREKRDWRSGNTEVVRVPELKYPNQPAKVAVYLHGNEIAEVWDNGQVVPNGPTFRDWPTATTRSRLCALGINASIRNGAACINGEPV
jgi:hypothetical protein